MTKKPLKGFSFFPSNSKALKYYLKKEYGNFKKGIGEKKFMFATKKEAIEFSKRFCSIVADCPYFNKLKKEFSKNPVEYFIEQEFFSYESVIRTDSIFKYIAI